jgi:hypothetical protein
MLQGILRGQHEKGRWKLERLVVNGDTTLLHRLQETALSSGGSSIDLIREEDVRKDRARAGLELRGLGIEQGHPEHVGWKEVTGELDPTKGETQASGQSVGQRGLPHAGNVLEEDMPSGQEGRQGKANHIPLAVEDYLDLIHEAFQELELGRTPLDHDGFRHQALGCGLGSISVRPEQI